ncbi:MAG: hypothetical protein HQ491_01950 [Bacteroidetes bacterium]|jgi:hypothetical protein|uniref:hypothetical protein n=1 Tax=Daejeonella sp. TaxID=2805397 RepID=UPI00404A7ACE|nr:hypothetical protein [Bacteroidota bacterium]
MIEISTPKTHSLKLTEVNKDITAEDLSEEDQSFYTTIKPCLNAMAKNPSQDTISNLVNYSKSI